MYAPENRSAWTDRELLLFSFMSRSLARRRLLRWAAAAGAACAAAVAGAQAPASDRAVVSPHTLTGNVAAVSDYRFRGISQTYRGPGIQGGLDYSHASGFYLGNWNASVASQSYTGGSGIEMDFYGGYRKSLGAVAVDIGTLFYFYPNAEFVSDGNGTKRYDTQELYLAGSWKWLSLKYSLATSDYFGLGPTLVNGGYWAHHRDGSLLHDHGGSSGTGYVDLAVTVPVKGTVAINAHLGRTKVTHYAELDYNDWKFGATGSLHGLVLGAAVVGTDADKDWYYGGGSKGSKEVGAGTLLFSVGKTF